ncbi:MAG: hypothetical protein JW704_02545 [Anaerolineaceae bacterium]|nr:hypothetical protein [Anaerolineaceae bacterium]
MLADLNQSTVILQVFTLNPDGTEKTDVASCTARVYRIVGGAEVDVLPATTLIQVGDSKWRYEWHPASLAVDQYTVEYDLVDDAGKETLIAEDLIVRDIATQTSLQDVRSRVILLQDDLTIVRKVETGRWKIDNNQMTFYDDDEVTPLLVFDLKDDAGLPSEERVFERVPA